MAGKPPAADPVQDAPAGRRARSTPPPDCPPSDTALRIAQQQMGVTPHGADPAAGQPEGRLRLPRLRLARAASNRHTAEFCENGAKAVAEEATLRRVTPDFFAAHPVADLATRSGYWLGQQGRLTQPMYLAEGADHYEPVPWERAFDIIAEELTALASPDEAALLHLRAAPATRPRSSTSSSPASSAPTTCPTAPTCATSRRVPRSPRPSASARAASSWRTSTRPT